MYVISSEITSLSQLKKVFFVYYSRGLEFKFDFWFLDLDITDTMICFKFNVSSVNLLSKK